MKSLRTRRSPHLLGKVWLLTAGLALLLFACGDPGPKGDPGAAGPAGADCSATDNGDGTFTVTCGETTVTLNNGTPGDSCAVVDNGDGTHTVTCGTTSVTLTDGAPGDSCTVVDNGDGTNTVSCGGVDVTVSDGASCGVVDNADGTKTLTCGSDVVTITGGGACTVVDNGDGTKTLSCDDGTTVTVVDGVDGAACWDLDSSGACTPSSEDVNGDGLCSMADCMSQGGEALGPDLLQYDQWKSGDPISRRIHAVHMGSSLNYPNTTIAHSDTIPGRNWGIRFPQDIRNCETCHPAGTTSGTWATKPATTACSGCHDSDAARVHMKQMTWDPTPGTPFSGDEEESCGACHGSSSIGVGITDLHGTEHLLSTGEYAACGPEVNPDQPDDCNKFFATINILSATADASGVASVTFTVDDDEGNPIVDYDATVSGWKSDLQFGIVKLEPASAGIAYNRWAPYLVTKVEVEDAGPWPNPIGTYSYIGDREDVEDFPTNFVNVAGTYTYTFDVDLTNVLNDVDGDPILDDAGAAITAPFVNYDMTKLHRVSVWTGGHEGPTAAATFDFVPDGGAAAETRNIVKTEASCVKCHGEDEFHGHGGDRLTVEDCNMCHNQSYKSPYNDEFISMPVMIHKIHAGAALDSIPGADGVVWDNPATLEDESADNGDYTIYRKRGGTVRSYTWWDVGFPSEIANCTKCHTGGASDEDNWKEVPSRDVCGSCHDTIDWAAGTNHGGGPQTSDATCKTCHPASGNISGSIYPIPASHAWNTKDPRHTPEYGVTMTVSTPGNGQYFVPGETPVVSVVLDEGGTPIDHTTVIQDDAKEGCTDADAAANTCPPKDGLFNPAYLFVHGPRANRSPVLSTAARIAIKGGAGPFDLSAAGASLGVIADGGEGVYTFDSSGGDDYAPGYISVDVSDGVFADVSAATAQEVVDWLNADGDFARRVIAYIEDGVVAIRSRNIGKYFGLQLDPSVVDTVVFGGNTSKAGYTSTYARNVIYQHADPADDDPKAAWTTGAITYTLDPVDDLPAGTYVASVEIADRGRINGSNYWTPTVGWVTFQVGTADEEMPVARNCNSCHQNDDNEGFVLDFPRHNKIFRDEAIDQCGACHDNQDRL